MEVHMRRSRCLGLKAFAAVLFVVACGADSVITGVRSDGITVVCNDGEYYYQCSPEIPPGTVVGNPTDPGGGSGSNTTPPPPPGGDGSGSSTGSGSGS